MKNPALPRRFLQIDTFGNLALAMFIICTVSGIILAIPYNINRPFDSISVMLIGNPAATIFRNLHYWSAQFFLVFTLLHTWDHFRAGLFSELSQGVWYRLSLGMVVSFFVMITGFILKGDAESQQAHRILQSLLADIPLAGDMLSNMIFGNPDEFQLIYVHHIATATLFLVYIIAEHSGKLWVKWPVFLAALGFTTLSGIFLNAPLHDGLDPVIKGPWYFAGLQEIMHWMSRPGLVWVLLILFFTAFWLMGKLKGVRKKITGWLLLALIAAYVVLTLIGIFFRGENWELIWPRTAQPAYYWMKVNLNAFKSDYRFGDLTYADIPLINDHREACLVCHNKISGFSAAHDPGAIGCSSCHLGNPFTLDKRSAHANMVLIPGNLAVARQTCGTVNCHPGITERVEVSLMATNSGLVSVDRYVFDESLSPDELSHIRDIGNSPADRHLRNLCSYCHLGFPKTATGPADELSRGGGCIACHLNYSEQAVAQHQVYQHNGRHEDFLPQIHPSLDVQVTGNHCLGCHSRSGRISTNYEGWHETLLEEAEVTDSLRFRILADKRVFEFVAEDVHHKAGLDCIDCHISYELMGDGFSYRHKEQAVKIKCEDCHSTTVSGYIAYNQLDMETRKIADLRRQVDPESGKFLLTASGKPLVNVIQSADSVLLISKNKGQAHPLALPASLCTGTGHESLTCSACHTAWAPQCIGCHNTYEPSTEGYDLLFDRPVRGTWVEFVGKFLADSPTLGVWDDPEKKIQPAVPGMILTIDASGFTRADNAKIFKRLFAPASPHTISSQGRSCKSCHNNPLAIGYGRGILIYHTENQTGYWTFNPTYSTLEEDGLPADAWIAFPWSNSATESMKGSDKSGSTRTGFRPFSMVEQQKILVVGACLSCHPEGSKIMLKSLEIPFGSYIQSLGSQCVLPIWVR